MTAPKVSVLMGIYNCADTLAEAVACIQAQSYQNWELILCDDASRDDTFRVAEELAAQEPKIVLLRNPTNCGLNHSLNRCFNAASGELLARMDGDDRCSSDRFEKQVRFLQSHPEYAIVSSTMTFFDDCGTWGQSHQIETPSSRDVVCGSPICHAPVMMRRECLAAVEGYSEEPCTQRVEDVDLWIRLYAAGFRCYNLQEPLYAMRNDQNAFSRRKYRYRVNSTRVRLRGCKVLHLGPSCYLRSFIPMIIGLVPAGIRRALRRKQRQNDQNTVSHS